MSGERYRFTWASSLYKLCLIWVKEKIGKERGTVYSHGDGDDLFEIVPNELVKCYW
jgi:hypothetical protein